MSCTRVRMHRFYRMGIDLVLVASNLYQIGVICHGNHLYLLIKSYMYDITGNVPVRFRGAASELLLLIKLHFCTFHIIQIIFCKIRLLCHESSFLSKVLLYNSNFPPFLKNCIQLRESSRQFMSRYLLVSK